MTEELGTRSAKFACSEFLKILRICRYCRLLSVRRVRLAPAELRKDGVAGGKGLACGGFVPLLVTPAAEDGGVLPVRHGAAEDFLLFFCLEDRGGATIKLLKTV